MNGPHRLPVVVRHGHFPLHRSLRRRDLCGVGVWPSSDQDILNAGFFARDPALRRLGVRRGGVVSAHMGAGGIANVA
jgi:hypothetical protein